MNDRLTTLLHDQAAQLDVPLTNPAELRRGAQHRQAVRRSATAVVVAAGLVLAVLAVSNPLGGARKHTTPVGPPPSPTRFAGVPSVGAHVSLPVDGTLVVGIAPLSGGEWNVYADGRIVWQRWTPVGDPQVIPAGADPFETTYVQQRLTQQGVQLLVSRILAIGQGAGLFRHSLSVGNAAVAEQGPAALYQVCNQGHLIYAQVLPPVDFETPPPMVTPAQMRALDQIADLVDVSKSTLPASVWADPTIRPYVPSHYELGWDRSAPDPSKLPSPAREALQNALQHKDQGLTIEQTRALLTAFAQSGVKLAHGNHANGLGFNVPGVSQPITVLRVRLTLPHSLLQNSQRC